MSSTNASSNAPLEPPVIIKLEHISLVTQMLICIAYGIFLTIAAITLNALLRPRRGGRISWFQVAYVSALLLGATFYVGPQIKFFTLMFVDDRNFPGGPEGFFATQFSRPSAVTAEAAFIIDNFLADGLMLYRTYLIYNFNRFIMILPVVWFMASTALSIITLDQSSRPDSSLFAKSSFSFAVPYFSLSMGLNLLLTLMIIGRLFVARRHLGAIGSKQKKFYSSIAAIFIESAAIYSITSLLFISLYGAMNPFADVFLGLLSQAMCIGPTLIIYRLSTGRGISKSTASGLTTGMGLPTTTSQATNVLSIDPPTTGNFELSRIGESTV